jgi:hypothetical protein
MKNENKMLNFKQSLETFKYSKSLKFLLEQHVYFKRQNLKNHLLNFSSNRKTLIQIATSSELNLIGARDFCLWSIENLSSQYETDEILLKYLQASGLCKDATNFLNFNIEIVEYLNQQRTQSEQTQRINDSDLIISQVNHYIEQLEIKFPFK